ncbi:MAG TPA: AmmeMemoRadiSam system protein B [Syntrophorhabdales bacterium]|nr:AmmeMemoRadiSam system protein B [Syntrophorhabdales bacterium]
MEHPTEYPKMRWAEVLPVSQDGREMFYLRDPEGLAEKSLVVSKDVLFLIALMDGKRSLRDLQEEYVRASGSIVHLEQIQSVVEAMDASLLLDNERFQSCLQQLKNEYEAAPYRPSCCSGKSYPDNREDLLAYLDKIFTDTEPPEMLGEMQGILAPHIDYTRGHRVYQQIYRYLPLTDKQLVVIFGTCHGLTPNLWNISLKNFHTPLGILPCASGMASLVRENPVLNKHLDEWCHRAEHSIELQLPMIQYQLQGRKVEILSILTGSMQEYVSGKRQPDRKVLQDLAINLKQVLEKYGKPYVIVAGADLAHIGAQFGDRYALDRSTLLQSKTKDEGVLEAVRQVDGQRFLATIRAEEDRRRICGLAPIYFQLSLLEGSTCDIVSYDQWTDGASSVSFAGAVFYR